MSDIQGGQSATPPTAPRPSSGTGTATGTASGTTGAGQADALVVAKLDRLSRSLVDFAGLMEQARQHGWAFIALDLGVDTTTPAGELVANVMASVAQWERRAIGARTREALAAKKAAGVQLGRPRSVSDDVVARIVRERESGRSLPMIAKGLNDDGVPTARGGIRWYPATVRSALLADDVRSVQSG